MTDQLTKLRAWAEQLLEVEAKATPGPWAVDQDDVFSVPSGCAVLAVDATNDEPLVIAARNSIRPLAEMVLALMDAIDQCPHPAGHQRCLVCIPNRVRLTMLAADVLSKVED